MEILDETHVKLSKNLSLLDKFVIRALDILSKSCNYVIVSGYVSILFGRPRGTEDIDILIGEITKEEFFKLYGTLLDEGYWCLNAESPQLVHAYIEEHTPIRIAERGKIFPNIELQVAKSTLEKHVLEHPLHVHIGDETIKISGIEYQILYKKEILATPKDVEDAVFLEEIFTGHLQQEKFMQFEQLLGNERNNGKE